MIWSANLAYAIGLLTTDGNLSKDGRHIDLTSKDLEQIETFLKVLGYNYKISIKFSGHSDKEYYRTQFSNVKFYRFLQMIGLTPNKTKTLGGLLIPNRYFADFLRGHLDGDGCTYSYWDTRWKSSFMLYTTFVSASKKHIEWLRDRIQSLYRLEGKIVYHQRSGYQLRFAKKQSIELLKILYYKEILPCLSRKRFKIEESLDIIRKQAEVAEQVYARD